ncbi:hypothetical protein AWB71_06141 [Caballeronia peredens]|nr:hypothetical protein AWB71_06141 [Caballeronia peredens]
MCQKAYDGGDGSLDSNAGFVLLKHMTETGEGRTLTFYSLYMHLLDLNSYQSMSADGKLLPEFLRMPSPGGDLEPAPAQSGNSNLKVRRKDVIGWIGGCHGQRHLHFEIFMTKSDHDAYFGRTQLGHPTASMATSSDCWGHTHFMIPGGKSFKRLPDGADSHGKLNGITFDVLQAGQNAGQLFVEMFFHKGSKYTNVWAVASDGKRTLLTPTPVKEADYEYNMYKRATALYSACASDGYELLRFGRILSTPVTLNTPVARATWMRVTFAAGQEGYIDVSDDTILKLSDADFSTFMGWQKITEGNTPFSADGLCDIDALKKILKDVKDHQTPQDAALKQEYKKEDVLAEYIKSNASVREQLRGVICEAPSEWDCSHNEERYRKLKDEGEFYHGDDKGYAAFMTLLKSFQFWDKTGLDAGQKLWFFHPLAFVRHFRKCGWLTLRDQTQLLPRKSITDAGGQISWALSNRRFSEGANPEGGSSPSGLHRALNHTFQKYGFQGSLRKAHFFGQIFKETGALRSTVENGDANYFRKMYENYTEEDAAHDFDHKHEWLKNLGFLKNRDRVTYIAQRPGEVHRKAVAGENVQLGDGARFCGRGLIHLTWRKGYREYGEYRAKNFTTDPNPLLLQSDAESAADSAGYFWVKTNINRQADHGANDTDVKACFGKVGGAGGLAARQQFFRYANFILGDASDMPADNTLERQTDV